MEVFYNSHAGNDMIYVLMKSTWELNYTRIRMSLLLVRSLSLDNRLLYTYIKYRHMRVQCGNWAACGAGLNY